MLQVSQRIVGALASSLLLASLVPAQTTTRINPWTVRSYQKISPTQGGLSAVLQGGDYFGLSMGSLGDLDGDGLPELVVGSPGDDQAGMDHGALYVLFLNPDGSVRARQKITEAQGGFSHALDDFDYFGRGVWSLGDLDDDGVEDLIVGAYRDDDGGFDAGAVYILFMNADGTVKADAKISNGSPGFTPTLAAGDLFGVRAAGLGDLDGDDVEDAVVAASFVDDAGVDTGALFVLFLNTDGTVKASQKISANSGGFIGQLDDFDYFGTAVAPAGDIDADGVVDLLVGARGDDDGGNSRGAVWLLFLNTDGTVKRTEKISSTTGGFRCELDDVDSFGISAAGLGDPDGDGRVSIAVGAFRDDDGGPDRGAVWILDLDNDGLVLGHRKVSHTSGGSGGPFGGSIGDNDGFGTGLALLDDLNGDGEPDLAIGAWNDDDGGQPGGSAWVLNLTSRPYGKLTPQSTFSLGLGVAGPTTRSPGQALGLRAVASGSRTPDGAGILLGLGGVAAQPAAVPGVSGRLDVRPPYVWLPGGTGYEALLPALGLGDQIGAQAVGWLGSHLELSPSIAIEVGR